MPYSLLKTRFTQILNMMMKVVLKTCFKRSTYKGKTKSVKYKLSTIKLSVKSFFRLRVRIDVLEKCTLKVFPDTKKLSFFFALIFSIAAIIFFEERLCTFLLCFFLFRVLLHSSKLNSRVQHR